MNKFDEMREAMREAKATLSAADHVAERLAEMLIGRLHTVSSYELKKLKAELRSFNMSTGRWKT